MFGFREIKEIKKSEKNLNFDPDARVKRCKKEFDDDLITTDYDKDEPWSPDTRVEWLAAEASRVIDEAWNEAMSL